jgi:hypothetical protein|tara:strand:- start:700 stop:807 length:108 start_codon:yes stop_codon:yes gene_type:complete
MIYFFKQILLEEKMTVDLDKTIVEIQSEIGRAYKI